MAAAIDFSITQAIVEGDAIIARSPNFREEWTEPAVALCRAFGQPLPGVDCPEVLFAKPFGKAHVAIASALGPPNSPALRFRLLILGRALYRELADPFAIADRFPPEWNVRGILPDLEWPPQPLPRRTIADLDAILKHGDGPFLLGASQTLVDGGKIALQRNAPESKLLRDLWALLPDSTRRDLWPATFALSNELRFDVVVLPSIPAKGFPGYLNDEQTRDYPDSRYERNLQIAIESGDQRALDRLLSRRSSAEALRLAVLILVLGIAILISAQLMFKLGIL